MKAFRDNVVHYNWHWFWHWGTGEALNNGTHFVDILRWGLGVEYPTLVTSVGGRYRFQDDWETPDTQLITYQFGDEASCSWEGRSCNGTPVTASVWHGLLRRDGHALHQRRQRIPGSPTWAARRSRR